MLSEHYRIALLLFALAGLSDGIDGILARHYGWTSRLGSLMDPIADKCLLLMVFTVLTILHDFPWFLLVLIFVRDIWILCGALAYYFLLGKIDFVPPISSKANTFFQIILVLFLLFRLAFSMLPDGLLELLMLMVMLTTVLSMLDYTWTWSSKTLKEYS